MIPHDNKEIQEEMNTIAGTNMWLYRNNSWLCKAIIACLLKFKIDAEKRVITIKQKVEGR